MSQYQPAAPRTSRAGFDWFVLLALLLAAVVVVAALRRGHTPAHPAPAPAPAAAHTANRTDPFTTIPRDTLPIPWLDWSRSTFELARQRRMGLVVLLDAGWCESCILYAGALAADPEAHAALTDRLLPVRVDIDRRPDVHARYHIDFSSLPSLVYLTPEGEVWDQSDALTPDRLVRQLNEMRHGMARIRPDPGIETLRNAEPKTAVSPLDSLAPRLFASLRTAWPAPSDSLGLQADLLESEALAFLHRYAEVTGSTPARALFLDGLRRLLRSSAYDSASGSFVQDIEPAPGRVTRAHLLRTNAMMLEQLNRAVAWDRDGLFERSAARLAAYLEGTLLDSRTHLFRSSQGTLVLREGRPVLTRAERLRLEASGHGKVLDAHVVPVYPTAGNAAACTALLGLEGRDAPSRRSIARQALAALVRTPRRTGHVPHDYALAESGSLQPSECDLLEDYATLGRALLAQHRLEPGDASWLRAARALADTMRARFIRPPQAAFFDRPWPDPLEPARMQYGIAGLADNGRAVLFMLEIAAATQQGRYREAGLEALRAWSGEALSRSPWEGSIYGVALFEAFEAPSRRKRAD